MFKTETVSTNGEERQDKGNISNSPTLRTGGILSIRHYNGRLPITVAWTHALVFLSNYVIDCGLNILGLIVMGLTPTSRDGGDTTAGDRDGWATKWA